MQKILKPNGIDLAQNFTFTGTVAGAGGGKLLQTQSVTTNGRTTISSGSFTGINGLEDTITPASTGVMEGNLISSLANFNSFKVFIFSLLRGR